jgi:hypothetical protein
VIPGQVCSSPIRGACKVVFVRLADAQALLGLHEAF